MAFVDSHTEGEPTRVVHGGLPALGAGPLREASASLLEAHPRLRAALVDEPRGYAALVGALLFPPRDPGTHAAVVFLNNVGPLPMCVHASIGIARTLVHLGAREDRPWARAVQLETCAGRVGVRLEAEGVVAVENVASYRLRAGVELDTQLGRVRGDIAWGGNWFLIVERSPIPVVHERIEELGALCRELAAVLEQQGLRGDDGARIDHIQLCGPSERGDARNFVLCPGGEYDRSPCGTGTSARMACLHADGRLAPGQRWRQEGITGSVFTGEVAVLAGERVRPTIRGRAWITAQGQLRFDPRDPYFGRVVGRAPG